MIKQKTLNEISKIENYFNQEINHRKLCSRKLRKYVVTFDYIDSFDCFKCNKWWSLYLFICKYCWNTSWNSRSKFYSNFFCNKNNKQVAKYNKKEKE